MSVRKNPIAYLGLVIAIGGTSYAVVGAAVASAGGQAGHRSASPGCYPKGSNTIAQDKAGRFFHIGPSQIGGSWYVCAFRQGTPRQIFRTRLGRDESPPSGPSAKVAGRYVAFFFNGAGSSGVRVIDMLTGHGTFGERSPLAVSNSLVLKTDGSVAWIASEYQVRRHDSTGTAVVDSGPGIDRHSLAAGGSWLYWTDDGAPRSAPFH